MVPPQIENEVTASIVLCKVKRAMKRWVARIRNKLKKQQCVCVSVTSNAVCVCFSDKQCSVCVCVSVCVCFSNKQCSVCVCFSDKQGSVVSGIKCLVPITY